MKMKAEELLNRYQTGTCTPEEVALLETWYLDLHSKTHGLERQSLEEVLARINSRLPDRPERRSKRPLWFRMPVAACIVIAMAFSIYFFREWVLQSFNQAGKVSVQIHPGGNRALLTLSNGSKSLLMVPKMEILLSRPVSL